MDLVQKITAKTRVSATLEEDGTLSLKVFGQAEYAKGKTTTAEVGAEDLGFDKEQKEFDPKLQAKLLDDVKAALKAVLADAAPILGQRVGKAIHKSAEVAAAHGEI